MDLGRCDERTDQLLAGHGLHSVPLCHSGELVFDLGIRRDWEKGLPLVIVYGLKQVGFVLDVPQDAAEALKKAGVTLPRSPMYASRPTCMLTTSKSVTPPLHWCDLLPADRTKYLNTAEWAPAAAGPIPSRPGLLRRWQSVPGGRGGTLLGVY
ncbi:hypothetical protein BKA93DRAFT_822834 [Sparassis latifolia]